MKNLKINSFDLMKYGESIYQKCAHPLWIEDIYITAMNDLITMSEKYENKLKNIKMYI